MATAAVKEPGISAKAKTFVAAFVTFVFLLPLLLFNGAASGDVLISMLRCFVMLVAALLFWSKSKLLVILGAVVSGLFAFGALTSLAGGPAPRA